MIDYINIKSKRIILIFLVCALLGTYYSLYLRDFQENLDDKVNFFLASLPGSSAYLQEYLDGIGDDSVYGYWRVKLLNNYPILQILYFLFGQLISVNTLTLISILLISASFLMLVYIIAIAWFFYAISVSDIYHRFGVALLLFSGSIAFSLTATFLGNRLGNRLSSLGIVGLDTAPYGLSILGTLLSAGLDLSYLGSTPRGSSLLLIMAMYISLLSGKYTIAALSVFLSSLVHLTYGIVGLVLLYIFLITTSSNKFSLYLLWRLVFLHTILLIWFQPPTYELYLALIWLLHLACARQKILFLIRKIVKIDFSWCLYGIYFCAAITKLILLPEYGFVEQLRSFLNLRDGYALFLSDFPRRIALITAPLCVLAASFQLSQKLPKLAKFPLIPAGYLIASITSIVFVLTGLDTGFPTSSSLSDLVVGSGTDIYLLQIFEIISQSRKG